ncbi:aminoglycoside 6-adenylyltransferase, partial [Helcococcus bovis]|uniref:aminoglycoside 6-adenylyltransferase n=1 Tax=Helcococcus bovis TaxID=3153252 RepID=UPI0038B9294F
DNTKNIVELFFINNEAIFSYISNNEKNVIIFDKDRILKDLSKEEVNSNWILPKEDEFIEEIIDFLFNLSEIAINYKNKNYIKASLLKNDLIDNLIYMLNCYISLKYNNHVIVDQYANRLRDYLGEDEFNEFEYIVSESARNDIWTIIFKAAQLYRTIGLYISEKLKYTYPKREDVRILNILREIYKEEE